MEILIKKATKRDIPQVLKIFEELSKSNSLKEGFLTYPLEISFLSKNIVSKKIIFLVAKENKKIVGYSLAYNLNEWEKIKPGWRDLLRITNKEKIFEENKLYFKHIGRLPPYPGVGLKLENEMYIMAKKEGYKSLIAEISKSPPNILSRKVHLKRGYVKIGEIKYSDGRNWEVFEKKL